MSLGNLKKLQAAERLLKQGKTSEALEQLERLAKHAPNDVLTINRMGDLLARQGRTSDAIGYYFKIAELYSAGGYLPKAIAIYKKIVRLDPKSSKSLSRLGELYLRQKLPAEAQRFLTTAAQQYEEAGDHAGAREAYEKLVEAAPDNPQHRGHLADAMAAAGDSDSALAELLNLGDTLQRSNKGAEAQDAYLRAQKLDPESAEPILGVARAMNLQGNAEGAIEHLAAALQAKTEPQILSELALLYEREGRASDTERLLLIPGAEAMPGGSFVDLLEIALSRGEVAAFWERLDRVTADWKQRGHTDRVGQVLDRLSQAEEHGHLPALERFERHLAESGKSTEVASVLERIVATSRTTGDDARADQAIGRLKAVAPASSVLATPETPPAPANTGQMPSEFEAPAVPLSRSDKEFVTGRLTQVEILEKYSLLDQAAQQVLEVTARFPGHVAAQQKLLALRRAGDPTAVRDTLVSLALACRAAGDSRGASSAAIEASQLGGLDPRTEEALQQLGLLPGAAAAQPVATPVLAEVEQPAAVASTAAPASVAESADGQDGLLIDFDDEDDVPAIEPTSHAEAPIVATPDEPEQTPVTGGPVRAPGPDMLSEIRQHLQQGRAQDAQKGIIALESLGYTSDELDALASQAGAMLQQPSQPPSADAADSDAALVLDLDAAENDMDAAALSLVEVDDLSTITAALEDDVAETEGPLTPDAGTEQSVDEVFAAFRQAVEEEVGDDSRTHYDLAIGYKEMGLLEEAIEGFQVAAKSSELAREAHMMLAVCHREQGDIPKAVEHYRLAASLDCVDQDIRVATHYDLAEVLIQSGDDTAALEALRQVLELDPGYRDVKQRIDDLETRLQV